MASQIIEEHALHMEVKTEKYSVMEGWITRNVTLFGSNLGRNILKGWEDLSDNITYRVRRG